MRKEDAKLHAEMLQMKITALSHLAYGRLESVETSLETEWVQKNDMTKAYLQEQQQDVYMIATIISDIHRDIERLNEAINSDWNNKKADNPDTLASDGLPTDIEQ